MKLSDDLFEDIRATLGLSEATTWEARLGRDSARAGAAYTPECAPRVEIEPFGQAANRRRLVALMDVSKRGVSIIDDRTWAAGEKFIIHLPRNPKNIIPLLCQVRNGRMTGTNFRIGAEFVEAELSSRELRRGTGGVTAGPSKPFIPMTQAGRQAPRRWFGKHAPAQLHTYQQETAGPILEAEIADLSDTGVGLICASQLAVGQTVMIRLCPPGGKTMTRMCAVVNCRLLDSGQYRIGTTFVESPKLKSGLQVLLGWFREKK